MPQKLLTLAPSRNLLVVSDVHMQHPQDHRTGLFCQFLSSVGASLPCDTLVLLGDIFDFVNARQFFYFDLWKDVFLAIRQLKDRGVKVIFVEGNHDYGFEHSPCEEIKECFESCGDMILTTQHPALGNILLLHSDDVICPQSYKIFRSIVKSHFIQTVLSPIPGEWTSALFSRYAQISRSKDDYRPLEQKFLTSCAQDFVRNFCSTQPLVPQFCVFGHIHVHLDDTLQGIRFLSGPAWFSAPSVLSFSETGEIKRNWLFNAPSGDEHFVFSNQLSSHLPLA